MGGVAARFARTNTEEDIATLLRSMKKTRSTKVLAIFVWSLVKPWARLVSTKRRVRLLAAIVPARHWFRAAIWMSRWHARITCAVGKSRPGIKEAYLRDDWLYELSRLGPFPVPMQVSGAESLQVTASDRRGIVLCATHIPLIMSVIRAAILTGHKPDLIVAAPHNIRLENNQIQPTGMSEGVPAVPPGPNALLRIRTILRRKGLIACTLDGHVDGPSPDLLMLAGRLGARVVIYRTSLTPNGIVNVSFQNAPYPFCDSEEAIEANMRAIQEDERRVFASLDGLTDSDTPIAVLSQPDNLPDVSGKVNEFKVPVIAPATPKASERPRQV